MYILLTDENIVKEIIPTFHLDLPGIPIEERYPADFVSSLLEVDDSTDVSEGLLYDEETGTFTEPPAKEYVEPTPEPEQPAEEPTVWDELDAAYQEGVNSAYDQ